MTTPLNHAKLGLMLPAILNPAVAAALGIGILAVGLYRLLPDDTEEETVEDVPSDGPKAAFPVNKPTLPTAEAKEVQRVDVAPNGSLHAGDTAIERDQSEMIRKAMSELGKRSAAARARKKAKRHDVA